MSTKLISRSYLENNLPFKEMDKLLEFVDREQFGNAGELLDIYLGTLNEIKVALKARANGA